MPPPGPVLGWLCVAHSVVDIAFRAAHISYGQVLPRSTVLRRRDKNDASSEGTAHTVKSFEASPSYQGEVIAKVTRPETILENSNYAAASGPCIKDSSDASLHKPYDFDQAVSKTETAQEQEPHSRVRIILSIIF